MKRFLSRALALSVLLGGGLTSRVQAIPGETVTNVTAWIQAHPTLSPQPTEGLVVHRTDTPARRFTFRASVFPVAGTSTRDDDLGRIIRTEQIILVDLIDGVTRDRLEEALRTLYDAYIYTDYQTAQVVYHYPSEERVLGNDHVVRVGELRMGDRFAYWVELVATPEGGVTSGTLTLFLKADLSALQAKLESP